MPAKHRSDFTTSYMRFGDGYEAIVTDKTTGQESRHWKAGPRREVEKDADQVIDQAIADSEKEST